MDEVTKKILKELQYIKNRIDDIERKMATKEDMDQLIYNINVFMNATAEIIEEMEEEPDVFIGEDLLNDSVKENDSPFSFKNKGVYARNCKENRLIK